MKENKVVKYRVVAGMSVEEEYRCVSEIVDMLRTEEEERKIVEGVLMIVGKILRNVLDVCKIYGTKTYPIVRLSDIEVKTIGDILGVSTHTVHEKMLKGFTIPELVMLRMRGVDVKKLRVKKGVRDEMKKMGGKVRNVYGIYRKMEEEVKKGGEEYEKIVEKLVNLYNAKHL